MDVYEEDVTYTLHIRWSKGEERVSDVVVQKTTQRRRVLFHKDGKKTYIGESGAIQGGMKFLRSV